MAKIFNTNLESLENELVPLILNKTIKAKIDKCDDVNIL